MRKINAIYYHRVDFDGVFSAFVASKFWETTGELFECIPFNYNETVPDLNYIKGNFKTITMIDISFPTSFMIDLIREFGKENIIWIDHHITSIRESEANGYSDLYGIRSVGYKGACELAWEFYFPNLKVPKIIQYISANDTWDKSRFSWTNTMAIQSALRAEFGVSYNKIYAVKDSIVSDLYLETYLLPKGKTIMGYLSGKWKSQVKNASFEITVAGRLRGLAMLTPDFSSAIFESALKDGYQVFCVCNIKKDAPGQLFSVSLYSEPDGRLGDFELGEYMKQNYSGGGHKCAAGGLLNGTQFCRLVFEKVI